MYANNQNPNAMDIGRTRARATMTEADKQRYQQEGLCFRCGNKGHISRNCPQRQNTPASVATTSSTNPATTPTVVATVKVEGNTNMKASERAAAYIAAMQADSDDVKAALEEQLFGKQGFSNA